MILYGIKVGEINNFIIFKFLFIVFRIWILFYYFGFFFKDGSWLREKLGILEFWS